MMDNTIITNPDDIIMIKINREIGLYAKIIDVVVDPGKLGFWIVKFYPFVTTKDFKLLIWSWLLDDDQIRGAEYTMNGIPHQLFKVEFPKEILIESKISKQVVDHIDKSLDYKGANNLSNLKRCNPQKEYADSEVPLPKLKNKEIPPFLRLIK